MKKTPKKRKKVLECQAVKRKGNGNLVCAPLKAFWPLCRGISKLILAVSVVILVSFVFLFVYHFLLNSPYLDLERVEIKGVESSVKPQLLALGDIRLEKSLLALNLHAVKRKLEKHPWIRTVELERRFPSTLVIHVEKHEPWAILPGPHMQYVNQFGEIFKKVDVSEIRDLPVITGISGKKNSAKLSLAMAMKVMHFLNGEKRPWSLADLAEIHVDGERDLVLYFEELPIQIKLDSGDLRKNIEHLRRVVAHLKRTGNMADAKTIDFNYADGAVVSFRKG